MLVVVAAGAVAFGVVVRAGETGAAVVLFVGGGTAAPGAAVDPVLLVPPVTGEPAGSVVSGFGKGGNGFDMTLAISSLSPASDLSWRNL